MLECPICNEKFEKAIMSHVRQIHGMEPSEFKEKFPGVPMRQAWMKGLGKDDPRVAKIAKASGDAKRGQGAGNAALPKGKWSRNYDKCTKCGTIESAHSSGGLCTKCRARISFDKQLERATWTPEEDSKLNDLLNNSIIPVKQFHIEIGKGKTYFDINKRIKDLDLKIPTDRRKKMARQNLPSELNAQEQSVIYGSLLGDGCICKQRYGNYQFRECHEISQYDYLIWKMEKLIRWTPKLYKHDDKRYDITTAYHDLWKDIYDKIYVSSKKRVISQWWLDKLTPLSVAIWIADDGGRHENGLRLCTHNFGEDCHELIVQFFKDKFDVIAHITTHKFNEPVEKEYNRLFIGAQEYRKLCKQLPIDELPECVHYKFHCEVGG